MSTPAQALERVRAQRLPAGARADELSFPDMMRRAEVLAKTDLVPRALQGKPDSIVLVGTYGAELGVPFTTSLQQIDVIEGKPDPSAQLRVALIRRAGHEVRWGHCTTERAVIRGRRREYRNDPDGWVEVEWTIEQARDAELVARWVEHWISKKGNDGKSRNVKEVQIVGDDRGIFTTEERARLGLSHQLPEWAQAELTAGNVKVKDNWKKYRADMLRARAAKALSRMEFSDVLAALGISDAVDYDSPLDLDDEHLGDIREESEPEEEDPNISDAEIVEEAPAATRGDDGAEAAARQAEASPYDDPPSTGPKPPPADVAPSHVTTWREEARVAGVTQTALLRQAHALAGALGVPAPTSLEEIGSTDSPLGERLTAWLADRAEPVQ